MEHLDKRINIDDVGLIEEINTRQLSPLGKYVGPYSKNGEQNRDGKIPTEVETLANEPPDTVQIVLHLEQSGVNTS